MSPIRSPVPLLVLLAIASPKAAGAIDGGEDHFPARVAASAADIVCTCAVQATFADQAEKGKSCAQRDLRSGYAAGGGEGRHRGA